MKCSGTGRLSLQGHYGQDMALFCPVCARWVQVSDYTARVPTHDQPDQQLPLLRHNKPRTEFWYEAQCCGRRQTANNSCLKEDDWRLIWAPELLKVASEQGLTQAVMMGATL